MVLSSFIMAEDEGNKHRLSYFLQNQMITDLKSYLNNLAQFPNLRYLSLKNNRIEGIPNQIASLQSLEQLDLSGNKLSNVVEALGVLKQLKKLKSLHIDINRSQRDKVKSILPGLQFINGQEVYSQNEKVNHIDWEPIKPSIQTAHLVEISNIYELIKRVLFDSHSEDSNIEFRQVVQSAFSTLTQNLSSTKEKAVRAMMITRTRTQLQRYCLELILKYLASSNLDLKILLEGLLRMQWREYSQMQKIVFYQSKIRADEEALLKTNEITTLKQTIVELKQEVQQLESRVLELQKDNEQYLQKLISYSKGNLSSLNNLAFDTRYKDVKLISYSTPIQAPAQKKLLTLSQLEDTILDIYDKKAKHETAAKKKTTMALFIKTFFIMSFGKDLAEQNESIFKESLSVYSASEQNNIVLFSKILYNQCQEEYANEQKILSDNLVKKFRSYARDNEKRISQINSRKVYPEDFQRIFDSKSKQDVNIDLSGLKTLLKEIMMSEEEIDYITQKIGTSRQIYFQKSKNRSFAYPSKSTSPNKSVISRMNSLPSQLIQVVSFKKVINIILNMHLKQHIQKIQKITEGFKERDQDNDGAIGVNEFIDMVAEIEDLDEIAVKGDKVLYSEVVEFMTKRKKKSKKKQ